MDCTMSMIRCSTEVEHGTMYGLNLFIEQSRIPVMEELQSGVQFQNPVIPAEAWDWLGVNGRATAYRLLRANQDLVAMVNFHRQRRQQDKLSSGKGEKPGSGYFDRACDSLVQVLKHSKWLHENCIG